MRQERKADFVAAAAESPRVLANRPAQKRKMALPFHLIEGAVIVGDFVLIVGTSVVAGTIYHAAFGLVPNIVAFIGIGAVVFINFFAITAARRNYKPQVLTDFWEQARELTLAWWIICCLLLAIAFSLKISSGYSRGATLTFFAAGWFMLICWRALLARSITRALADGGFSEQRIVILGTEGQVAGSKAIQELTRCGYNPVRTFELRLGGAVDLGINSSARILLQNLIETCRHEAIDQVFLLVPWQHRRAIEQIMAELGVLSIPIHLLPDENVAHFLGNRVVTVGTVWTAELKRSPLSQTEQIIKRSIDLVLALIGLVMFAPVMILVAAMIKLETRGPVFFIQGRNGFNGQFFGVRKFRTMRVWEDGPVVRQATRNDPRVTRIGWLLRRTNVDELPQLFNVIAGDMSLVGPRPHAVSHNSEYEKLISNYAFRYHVKPGITGWAQVNGLRGETRSVEVMARRVDFDLWYINNWSIWLDIKILFRTLLLGIQSNAY